MYVMSGIKTSHKRRLWGIISSVVAVTLSFFLVLPKDALACTQIYVGPQLTRTGDVYVGRAEDYAQRHPKAFGIQEARQNPEFSSDESNFRWTYAGTSYRYTYVRDLPSGWDGRNDAYSEAGTNEMGVSVSATLTTDYNNQVKAVDPCGNGSATPSGLGEYTIADIVLACSPTAREGVKLLGRLIDQYGNYDCNQIVIADNTETWLFTQLSGHQWIAINLTGAYPNKASVNPNIGQLKYQIDLNNENVCLHSERLEETAVNAGSATYFEDGTLDVATSYGNPQPGASQYTRLAQGRAYFGAPLVEGSYTMGAHGVASVNDPQLLFTPGVSQVDLFTMLRSFAARGEQDSTLNANTNAGLYAIGNNRTVEAHMYQIRSGMSADIATIQWVALSRSEFSIAIPSYSALLTEVDTTLYPPVDSWNEAHTGPRENVDSVDAAMDASTDNGSLDYVLMDINTLAYNNRDKLAANTRAYLDALQKQLIAQQEVVDKIMQQTPTSERTKLANKLHKQASAEVYAKTKALLDEMRNYLKGDQSAPFVPSDYDVATGLARTPISYATAFVTPVFTSEPQDVSVEKGNAVTLSAEANLPDGIEGSNSQLTYEWFRVAEPASTENSNAPAADVSVGTGQTLTVNTSEVGTARYYCVATNNASGLTAVSRSVTVTVSNSAGQDSDSGQDQNNQGQNQNNTDPGQGNNRRSGSRRSGKGNLPQTSDSTNLLIPLSLGIAGTALITTTSVLRLKRRNS